MDFVATPNFLAALSFECRPSLTKDTTSSLNLTEYEKYLPLLAAECTSSGSHDALRFVAMLIECADLH
jgi:hypothetical protein